MSDFSPLDISVMQSFLDQMVASAKESRESTEAGDQDIVDVDWLTNMLSTKDAFSAVDAMYDDKVHIYVLAVMASLAIVELSKR